MLLVAENAEMNVSRICYKEQAAHIRRVFDVSERDTKHKWNLVTKVEGTFKEYSTECLGGMIKIMQKLSQELRTNGYDLTFLGQHFFVSKDVLDTFN